MAKSPFSRSSSSSSSSVFSRSRTSSPLVRQVVNAQDLTAMSEDAVFFHGHSPTIVSPTGQNTTARSPLFMDAMSHITELQNYQFNPETWDQSVSADKKISWFAALQRQEGKASRKFVTDVLAHYVDHPINEDHPVRWLKDGLNAVDIIMQNCQSFDRDYTKFLARLLLSEGCRAFVSSQSLDAARTHIPSLREILIRFQTYEATNRYFANNDFTKPNLDFFREDVDLQRFANVLAKIKSIKDAYEEDPENPKYRDEKEYFIQKAISNYMGEELDFHGNFVACNDVFTVQESEFLKDIFPDAASFSEIAKVCFSDEKYAQLQGEINRKLESRRPAAAPEIPFESYIDFAKYDPKFFLLIDQRMRSKILQYAREKESVNPGDERYLDVIKKVERISFGLKPDSSPAASQSAAALVRNLANLQGTHHQNQQ